MYIPKNKIKRGRIVKNAEIDYVDMGRLRKAEILEVERDRVKIYDVSKPENYIREVLLNGGLD